MEPLTPNQMIELEMILTEFVQDRALDGFHCVVIINGRGIAKTAYAEDTRPHAPEMLAAAYASAMKHNNSAKAN